MFGGLLREPSTAAAIAMSDKTLEKLGLQWVPVLLTVVGAFPIGIDVFFPALGAHPPVCS